MDDICAIFGSVHVLVNSAGFPRDKHLVKMSEDDWDFVIQVMLKGAFLATRSVMPHMIKQGYVLETMCIGGGQEIAAVFERL